MNNSIGSSPTFVPDGSYLVYSMGIGKPVFGGDFTIMIISNGNNKLTIQASDGQQKNLLKSGTSWSGDGYTIEARQGTIRGNNMMIGRATRPGEISTFVAIHLPTGFKDFSPILINDTDTEYEIFYQNSPDGLLIVKKEGQNQLKFMFTLDGSQEAVTPGSQAPGRFNALKGSTSGRPLYGFVLPHLLRENGQTYRVLVGHAGKAGEGMQGSLCGPDDIEPYVAVASNSGTSPGGEG